jgi:hypothetical protein
VWRTERVKWISTTVEAGMEKERARNMDLVAVREAVIEAPGVDPSADREAVDKASTVEAVSNAEVDAVKERARGWWGNDCRQS